MGKIGGTLFGKPASSSTKSGDYAYNDISSAYKPALGYVTGGGDMMGNLLGVGGAPAQTDAIQNFADSGGMKFLQDQGERGITSSKAAQGLLQSGSYGEALADYNHGLASTYLSQYLGHLNDYAKLGLGAGGVLSDAGRYSTGTEKGAKKGIAGDLLKAASMIPGVSDRRLKKNVEKIGEYADGLGRYRYEYVDGYDLPTGVHEGPMADEVAVLRPWAYIPNFLGKYSGVHYGKLGN